MNDEDFVSLNSHDSHGDETPEEKAKREEEERQLELKLLNVLQCCHLFGVFAVPFMIWLKSKECYLIKQALQSFLMITYFGVAWYVAYIAKINMDDWKYHVNEVRIMLFIEVYYVFSWIISSILFTTAAQLFNFKSTVLTDFIL